MFILKDPALAEMERWLDGVIERLDEVIADPEHAGQEDIIREIRALTAELKPLLLEQEDSDGPILH